MRAIPVADRIIVEPTEALKVSTGGIIIPEAVQEKQSQGVVVAVGEGKFENGNRIRPCVRPGDVVVYGKFAGTELKIEGKDYLIMRENDVLVILPPEPESALEPALPPSDEN